MEIKICKGDITKMNTDAIVNAANTSLLGGSGVDGTIHRAAGKELLADCRGLNGCKVGEAKLTKGYNLKARYIIHTVGPVYNGGHKKEAELLYRCYYNSLALAQEHGIKTIAFPCISTGIYQYPFKEACKVALTAAMDFNKRDHGIAEVTFVCFSDLDYESFLEIYDNI